MDREKKEDKNNVSVSSLKCNNININVNGLQLEVLPPALSTILTGGEANTNAYSYGNGTENYGSESLGSENDFRYICINNNNNTVIGDDEEEPISPTTASLTVKKQVFGCTVTGDLMDCTELQNNSTAPWLDCNSFVI